MRRLRAAAIVLAAALAAAWLFWPERWVVNGPMLQSPFGRTPPAPPEDELRARLRVPPGFTLTRFASDLPNVRMLRATSEGDLLASQPRAGQIALIRADKDGDGHADGVATLLEGLDRPHGLDWRDGWLYVAVSDGVRRVRFHPAARAISGAVETVVAGLPAGGGHWTRTVRMGPDEAMYVSIGSSCNVCVEKDPRRAAIVRYTPEGRDEEVYATGLRNAVGFDWHPLTSEMFATDNGRDLLGDDFPPCELNRIERGGFYGWPFANGDRVRDPDLGEGRDAEIARSQPPVHSFRAHNAPLGLRFLIGETLPDDYRAAALVALHGSWNRTRKDGYKVVSLHWGPDGKIAERDFLTGFLDGEKVIGRPVDIVEGTDGALYISDDYGGAIHRVAFGAPGVAPAAAPSAAAPRPPTASAETLARGHALYVKHDCAKCHERGMPDLPPVILSELSDRYTVESIMELLKAPPSPMPVFPMNDDERSAVAAYVLDKTGAR